MDVAGCWVAVLVPLGVIGASYALLRFLDWRNSRVASLDRRPPARRIDARTGPEIRDVAPDTPFGARPLPKRRTGATLGERMRQLAELSGGMAVLERSTVEGHVSWPREGRVFSYSERLIGLEWWGAISVRLAQPLFPAFQVYPRDMDAPFAPLPVTSAHSAGGEEFDARFHVRLPEDEPDERFPLAAETWVSLVQLDRLLPAAPVLEAQPDRARVCVPSLLLRAQRPELALAMAFRVLDGLLAQYGSAAAAGALQLVDAFVAEGDHPVVCRVCGEGVGDLRAECARCGAPHHPECWSYIGACAIYACQGKERR